MDAFGMVPVRQILQTPVPADSSYHNPKDFGSFDIPSSSASDSDDECRRDMNKSRIALPWNGFHNTTFSLDEESELTVTNLPPYEPHTLQEMLTQLFGQRVPVIDVSVCVMAEGPVGSVRLRSEWDARLAISHIHKRHLDSAWNGRRLVLSIGFPPPAPNLNVLRSRIRAILLDKITHCLPVLRLRDAYASRYCSSLYITDLVKINDTVKIHEGMGRRVELINLSPMTKTEVEEAQWKCVLHAGLNGCDDSSRMLKPVYIELSTLTKNVHTLLKNHGEILPYLSFLECYEAMFLPLEVDVDQGVCLELLLRSVPGLQIKEGQYRYITRSADPVKSTSSQPHLDVTSSNCERKRPRTAPSLEPILALLERELLDLLCSLPRSSIPFNKIIPHFHHYFGRQCRIADYGYTKLPDLLAVTENILVLGSGSSRVITLSSAAQSRRWSSDLLKLLKAHYVFDTYDIPQLYEATFKRAFSPADYAACSISELMQRVTPQLVTINPDGSVSLPRREPTILEKNRTLQFAMQAMELLFCTPNMRMEISRFMTAYQVNYGRQLRVAHYGCVKVLELFEVISDYVSICSESNGDKYVRLAPKIARKFIGERLQLLGPMPLSSLSRQYVSQFSVMLQPEALEVSSLEELVFAVGGAMEDGVVHPPGTCPRWASAALAAATVLVADRSVARSSTLEYFETTFRCLVGKEPELRSLQAAGVVELRESSVQLTAEWRKVWRVASLLDESSPKTVTEILEEYTIRYDATFCKDSASEFLRQYESVFSMTNGICEMGVEGWQLSAGVKLVRPSQLHVSPFNSNYSVSDVSLDNSFDLYDKFDDQDKAGATDERNHCFYETAATCYMKKRFQK